MVSGRRTKGLFVVHWQWLRSDKQDIIVGIEGGLFQREELIVLAFVFKVKIVVSRVVVSADMSDRLWHFLVRTVLPIYCG